NTSGDNCETKTVNPFASGECVDLDDFTMGILGSNCADAADYCTGDYGALVGPLCPVTCGKCDDWCTDQDSMMGLWASQNAGWPVTCAEADETHAEDGIYMTACGGSSNKCSAYGSDTSGYGACTVNADGNACANDSVVSGFVADGDCACDCTAIDYEGDTCETATTCADGHTCSNGGAITGTTVVAGDCACDCSGTDYEGEACETATTCQDAAAGGGGFAYSYSYSYDGFTCENGGAATGTTVVSGDCACDCTGTGYEGESCEVLTTEPPTDAPTSAPTATATEPATEPATEEEEIECVADCSSE
ncbi:hypothetical protein TeGR_g7299, partial [Tetraparma gracilis]